MNLFYLGEPLLCRELPAMIKYAHKSKIRISVSSNLNILDETMAEQLIRSELDYLIVSLDGATPETYAKYRIGGDYHAVIKNIKAMVEKKRQMKSVFPRILIQFVVFRHNEAEVASVKELARSLGLEVFFRQGALGGKDQSPPLTKDRSLAEKWLTQDAKYQTEYDYFSEKPYIKSGACGYLWNVATINWDGSLLPCCWVYDSEYRFGNILEQDFKDIWNNVAYRSSRGLYSRGNTVLSSGAKPKGTICHQCKMFRHIHNG
jgi:radical SAM protein with 4Fe4S-binding SPASM domain